MQVDGNNNPPIVYQNQPPVNPSYVYLSQVPYTGVGSTAKIVLFGLSLLGWSAFVAYMVIRKHALKKAMLAGASKKLVVAAAKPVSRNPAADAVFNRISRKAVTAAI